MQAPFEEIKRELGLLMASGDWYDATRGQYPEYVDRLGFVTGTDGRPAIASTLRPADSCGSIRCLCWCWLPVGHDDDTAHLCGCGGSWRPDGSVVRYPGPFGNIDILPADQLPSEIR